jgi:hypothetical protein
MFVLAGKDRYTSVQLGENAPACQLTELKSSRREVGPDSPQTPHVNRHGIIHAQDDFRRPVESRLNVRVHYSVSLLSFPLHVLRTKSDLSPFRDN